MDEEEIATALIQRATRLKRRLLAATLTLSLLASVAVTAAVMGDSLATGEGGGRLLGKSTGAVAASSFLTCMAVGLYLGRTLLRARLLKWVRAAREQHRLEPDALRYVVAMFAEPPFSDER